MEERINRNFDLMDLGSGCVLADFLDEKCLIITEYTESSFQDVCALLVQKNISKISNLVLCGNTQYTSAVECLMTKGMIDQSSTIYGGADSLYQLLFEAQTTKQVLIRGKRVIKGNDYEIRLNAEHGYINHFSLYMPSKDEICYQFEETENSKEEQMDVDKIAITIVGSEDETIKAMQKSIIDGIGECNQDAISVFCFHTDSCDADAVIDAVKQSKIVLLGSHTVDTNISPKIWELVTKISPKHIKGKKFGLFYVKGAKSCGDEALRLYLKFMGADMNVPDYAVVEKLEEEDQSKLVDYGFDIGCISLAIPNPRKPQYVKCLVCGEIFDASLGICPVCGVGLDQCVPVTEDELLYHKDTQKKYLILGGGIAAVSAAEAIRNRDKTGSIVLLSKEDYLPLNRPILTKDFRAATDLEESIFVHPDEWYAKRAIQVKTGETASEILSERRQVATESGDTYSYDELIIATGAECFVPPFEGYDRPEVVTIRHLEDCQKIDAFLDHAKKVVVIGGGVLGLEAANEFFRMGLEVTILEASPQIIGRQIDSESAAILKEKIKGFQIELQEGVSIKGLEIEDDKLKGVNLEDGRMYEADFVVVSCGNRGNVKIAEAAGITVDRSIVVDAQMRTNLAHVFACGDCCQFDGINYQLWQEASEQGKTAGANAAGETMLYASTMLGLHLDGFGTTLYALGDPGKKQGVNYKKVTVDDQVLKKHKQYWFSEGVIAGVVAIGYEEEVPELTNQVNSEMSYKHMFEVTPRMNMEKSIEERDRMNAVGGC